MRRSSCLHGLPSSSRIYEQLLVRLSDRYRLIAPDYPGFGHSATPMQSKFAYTFNHLAGVMTRFTATIGLSRYSLVMQDDGGPIGFSMAVAHTERVGSLIAQNAVAHDTGLGDLWLTRRAFWAARQRHVGRDPDVERYHPDLSADEFAFLSKPGQADMQTAMFYDYRNNVAAYPKWQDSMRKDQPRLLVLWGKYDPSFDISEPDAYRRDISQAEVHILEAGHFALDTATHQIANLFRDFL